MPKSQAFLQFMSQGQQLIVTYHPPTDAVRAEKGRRSNALQIVLRFMRAMDPIAITETTEAVQFCFAKQHEASLRLAAADLETKLEATFDAPISAKRAVVVLGITPQERRRWTKDGRLKPVGHQTSNRGAAPFRVPVFDPGRITELLNSPEIIARWRKDDQR